MFCLNLISSNSLGQGCCSVKTLCTFRLDRGVGRWYHNTCYSNYCKCNNCKSMIERMGSDVS